MGWQAGTFPESGSHWRSDLADSKLVNVTGSRNSQADEILTAYRQGVRPQKTCDALKRARWNHRERASILPRSTHGFDRIAYQNSFGRPDYYFTRIRIGEHHRVLSSINPDSAPFSAGALLDPAYKLEVSPSRFLLAGVLKRERRGLAPPKCASLQADNSCAAVSKHPFRVNVLLALSMVDAAEVRCPVPRALLLRRHPRMPAMFPSTKVVSSLSEPRRGRGYVCPGGTGWEGFH